MLRIREPLARPSSSRARRRGDGHDCVDTHAGLEWGWKGECERNAPHMAQSCPLTSCVRRNVTLEVGVDGTAVMEVADELHGDVRTRSEGDVVDSESSGGDGADGVMVSA